MFNFKIKPIVKEQTEEQKKQDDLLVQEFAEKNRRKALSNSMQATVLNQLASVQPSNPNAQSIPPQNVENKQGW
jgi:hypothetical protein